MTLQFYKYQGTGNDFVVFDNRKGIFPKQNELIKHLCQHKFGIGSDGLILIENNADTDFEMVFYNPDASQSFCGNGSRCAVKFAQKLGIVNNSGSFKAIDGIHEFTINEDIVSIKMRSVSSIESKNEHYFLNTGSPHFVCFTNNIQHFDIVNEGRKIRYSEEFKSINGTNVNAVEVVAPNKIKIATYERGVEDETLSCGTGVTACAIIQGVRTHQNHIDVLTKGGELKVEFSQENGVISNIWLSGPALEVFSGQIEL